MSKSLFKSVPFTAGVTFAMIILVLGVFANFIALHDPRAGGIRDRNVPPVFLTVHNYQGREIVGSSDNLLGTDHAGRDVLSRLIWSFRLIALTGTIGLVFGTLIAAILIPLRMAKAGARGLPLHRVLGLSTQRLIFALLFITAAEGYLLLRSGGFLVFFVVFVAILIGTSLSSRSGSRVEAVHDSSDSPESNGNNNSDSGVPGLSLKMVTLLMAVSLGLYLVIRFSANSLTVFLNADRADLLLVMGALVGLLTAVLPFSQIYRHVRGNIAAGEDSTSPTFSSVLRTGIGLVPANYSMVLLLALVSEAVLAYFGLSASPVPTLGSMVDQGRNYLASAWWATLIPLFVIFLAFAALLAMSKPVERIHKALDAKAVVSLEEPPASGQPRGSMFKWGILIGALTFFVIWASIMASLSPALKWLYSSFYPGFLYHSLLVFLVVTGGISGLLVALLIKFIQRVSHKR